jgi:hypothetical protein
LPQAHSQKVFSVGGQHQGYPDSFCGSVTSFAKVSGSSRRKPSQRKSPQSHQTPPGPRWLDVEVIGVVWFACVCGFSPCARRRKAGIKGSSWLAKPLETLHNLATFVAKALLEVLMGMPVRIESHLYELARSEAAVEKRTIAGQIEYWAMVGRAALDNPDLPVTFVAESLVSMAEPREQATPFIPRIRKQ